jgi:lipopolysaccharide transport system ATP-binding protein
LNGALLGMKRVEIKRKFDKIIDFSGVEEFIDTPVKKYSSGMYVRLAFAVAAHLEPEILLVDEVLAVGDAEFQKKCLGKMGEVAKGGRTVVFVSHNMEAIINLCPCSIYLEKGKFISKNYSEEIINQYSNLQSNNKLDGYLLKNHYSRYSSEIQIQKIKYQNKIFFITLSVTKAYEKIGVVFIIKNLNGLTIFKTSTSPIWSNKTFSISEKCHITLNLDNLHLISGNYILGLAITIPNERFLVEIDNAMLFSVNNHSIYEGSKILSNKTDGYIMTKHKWIIDST